jgi:hypothetical protein
MRKSFILGASALALIAVPASALGLDDLLKTVLGGKSILKKAETKCGKPATLTASENRVLNKAVSAVRAATSPQKFASLDSVARAEADTQAQDETFCPETKKKKKSILSKIGKAGKAILKGKTLGL